ncbi:MAG: type IV pili methyl-accepting chemotaxis transducer N-terminal domain-containing protein [Pseudooceanicola sp.]
MRNLLLGLMLGLVIGEVFPPAPAWANGGDRALALNRVNVAGRQRMLSQRIAMATCVARAGASGAENAERARAAMELFASSQVALRRGDRASGLRMETRPDVLAALADVTRQWKPFRETAAEALEADGPPGPRMLRLRVLASQLLRQANDAVGMLERAAGEGADAPNLAATLNVAGRQRMLIQKAVMQACFVSTGIAAQEAARDLLATRLIFERSLASLLIGNDRRNIISAPTPEIDRKLVDIIRIWRWMEPDLRAAMAGETLAPRRLALLADGSDFVLARMNEIVSLYEGL